METIRTGLSSIVTGPFGASIVKGNPSPTGNVVDVVVDTAVEDAVAGAEVVASDFDVVVRVSGGASPPESFEVHAAARNATPTTNGMDLRIIAFSSLWRRTATVGRPLLRRLAAHRPRGDLATSRGGSQLRDSAGISPDFARCRNPDWNPGRDVIIADGS
jgi:hypothetical protein